MSFIDSGVLHTTCGTPVRPKWRSADQHEVVRRSSMSTTIPGVTCAEPRGAFYAYPNLGVVIGKDGIANTTQLAERLLADQRLAVVP